MNKRCADVCKHVTIKATDLDGKKIILKCNQSKILESDYYFSYDSLIDKPIIYL